MLAVWGRLGQKEKVFLSLWCAVLFIVALTSGIWLSLAQSANLSASIQRHAARVGAAAVESGQTEAEQTPPPGHEKDVPRTAKVGIYLDRIAELSIVGSSWKADFYVWFTWTGDGINPGESFQVVNGEILSKTLVEKKDVGKQHYVLYRTIAQITKGFDIQRFPRDDHMLTISIEDGANQSYQLRFEGDEDASDLSSRVRVPGYKVLKKVVSVKPHSYKTSRGNPELPPSFRATYSQFTLGVWIGRPDWGMFFKLTGILYAAVLMALLALFVRSSCDRLALQTGAIFAAAANAYIISGIIPETGVATLADHMNWIGIACIGIAILQAVIYQYRFEGVEERKDASWLFDVATFSLLALVFVGLNVAVSLSASL
ncbi:MAG: hypothetical protein JWQ72_3047 [Polaromonas sp.]|nr:hypothetical protein [Polaromonas sp.]